MGRVWVGFWAGFWEGFGKVWEPFGRSEGLPKLFLAVLAHFGLSGDFFNAFG